MKFIKALIKLVTSKRTGTPEADGPNWELEIDPGVWVKL